VKIKLETPAVTFSVPPGFSFPPEFPPPALFST
jgi:hypothetical protein